MEKPILLNTEEVKAILDGRKTMTRRVINAPVFKQVRDPNKIYWKNDQVIFQWHGDTIGEVAIKPPCQPGDILWVRETWAKRIHSDNRYYYKADNNLGAVFNRENNKWRPSIHMPREAARLFLRVKGVRVERLQKCGKDSIFDLQEEGIDIGEDCRRCIESYGTPCCNDEDEYEDGSECGLLDVARTQFVEHWDSTIKKQDIDRYGWAANPWVWVIEFERVEV